MTEPIRKALPGRLWLDRPHQLGAPPPPPPTPTADWLFAEGQLAWLRGDLQRAIGKLREVVEMDRAHQEAHLSLSRLYLLTDREDLAMRHSVVATDLLRGHRPA